MKKSMSKALLFAVSTAAVFAAGESQAQADNYPNKPIRVIVPWNPGGASDVLVRGFQPFLEKELGQRLVIENIGAGATVVGTNELIKA